MKMTNLWIRKKPVSYIFTDSCTGLTWHTAAPFQVVLLDFGFACIGGDNGFAAVSVAHDIFPKLDPCPKEGRDMFQFIISMWSLKEVRDKLPANVHSWVEELLKYKSISYSDVSQKVKHSGWSYLVVSDSAFHHPPMHPLSLLRQLNGLCPSIVSF